MDDDNVAKPHELETFVRAAINSGSDLLTTPSDLIYGDEFPSPFRKMKDCWLPLGADLNVASFANCFGDANAMIRKSVFESVVDLPRTTVLGMKTGSCSAGLRWLVIKYS